MADVGSADDNVMGYSYRLCPANAPLTEACFQKTPMPFAGDSRMMMSNGTMLNLSSTFVSEGTLPAVHEDYIRITSGTYEFLL